ncbi:MAG TPA: hypothetical protein DCQ64_15940 [Candidatus Rokubacteria bacterium]|nr:hypothetical protein [Candidatus Rokubacteria bacterium]
MPWLDRLAYRARALADHEAHVSRLAVEWLPIRRQILRRALTPEVLAAVMLGDVDGAVAALRVPPAPEARTWLRSVHERAWHAGRAMAKAQLSCYGEAHFAESDATRLLRKRREIRAMEERRLQDYRQTGRDRVQLDREAAALVRETIAEARYAVRYQVGSAKQQGQLREMLRELEQVVAGTGGATLARLAPAETVPKRFQPAREIDWSGRAKGSQDGLRGDARVEALIFVAAKDERTTPACAFLDGAVIAADDPEIDQYAPPFHYGCRSITFPATSTVGQLTWDRVLRRSVGEPNASGARRAYAVRPREIVIPGDAPDVAPPESLEDWLQRGRGGSVRKKPTPRGTPPDRKAPPSSAAPVRAPGGAPPRSTPPTAPASRAPAAVSPQVVASLLTQTYEALTRAAHSRRVAIPDLIRQSELPADVVHAKLLAGARAGTVDLTEHDHPYEVPEADRKLVLPWTPPSGPKLPLGGYYFVRLTGRL